MDDDFDLDCCHNFVPVHHISPTCSSSDILPSQIFKGDDEIPDLVGDDGLPFVDSNDLSVLADDESLRAVSTGSTVTLSKMPCFSRRAMTVHYGPCGAIAVNPLLRKKIAFHNLCPYNSFRFNITPNNVLTTSVVGVGNNALSPVFDFFSASCYFSLLSNGAESCYSVFHSF